ncbi:MAG: glycosyltransferase family 1 protein [Patescibacteria group bacterium]
MIIGVDIRPMTGLRTGVQEYTEQLLAHMIPLAPEHKFKLFFSSFRDKAPHLDWMYLPNVEVLEYKIPNNLLFFAGSVFGQPYLDDLMGGVDVFFSPHFFLAPLSSSCRRVTTFHDLSFVRFPEFFKWRKRWWHNVEMNPSHQASFSDKIIAVSDSTKKDLESYYQIDPANIEVVPLGSHISRPIKEYLVKFKKDRQLPDKYILYIGTVEPRKNIIGLVRAFNIIKQQSGFEELELIIGGKKGWQFKEILDEFEKSQFRNKIKYLGHLKDEDRAFYYSLASVFVYPSFFEGFGSPVLEAMACGTPVITSANSSLPRVAGDAGLLIDPYNISDLAEALSLVITNTSLHSHMSKEGLERAQKFNWDNIGRKTLDILVGR